MTTPRDIAHALQRLGRRPIVIASHPRSGTHLVIDLFRRQFRECRSWKWYGENLNRLYLSLEALFVPASKAPISEAKALAVLGRVARPLIKTHLLLPDLEGGAATRPGELGRHWIEWLRTNADVCYVHRDGRDAMCSYHLYRKSFDPEALCPLGEFIRQPDEDLGTSRARAWAHHVRRFLEQPGVRPVRFEDVVGDTRGALRRLAEDLRLTPVEAEPLLPRKTRNLWHGRLNRLLVLRPESSAILGRPPGHRLERWRDVFTREDREFFHREAGDVLLQLGYESSPDWIASPCASRTGC